MSEINWDAWQFLLGEWVGEGSSETGQGSASFSFNLDLQQKVLVRRNHIDYPAAQNQPAYSHDDLIVIYQEPDRPTRASYFDNEGNAIHYLVELSKDQNAVTFLSEPQPSAPRFRLTYVKSSADTLTIRFEIAPPGQPDDFTIYTEGTARRK